MVFQAEIIQQKKELVVIKERKFQATLILFHHKTLNNLMLLLKTGYKAQIQVTEETIQHRIKVVDF